MSSEVWTINKLAEATGLDRKTLTGRLRAVKPAGEARKNVPGYALDAATLRALVAAGEVQAERGRLTRAQAALAELELKKREGELLPADEVARADEAIFTAIKDALLALPDGSAEQLCEIAAAEGPAGVSAFLRERIEMLLEDAAKAEFVDVE